jgi:hypothetical protein
LNLYLYHLYFEDCINRIEFLSENSGLLKNEIYICTTLNFFLMRHIIGSYYKIEYYFPEIKWIESKRTNTYESNIWFKTTEERLNVLNELLIKLKS